MSDPMIIALPSKGRLQEETVRIMAKAGFPVEIAARGYRATVTGAPIEVLLLPSAEIPAAIASGKADFGVVGEDLWRETIEDADNAGRIEVPLGFGHAALVVAVPAVWLDVETMADLDDVAHRIVQAQGRRMRVATKYLRLTRRWFARHGITDYRLIDSAGATEGAPAAGHADAIVDITSTGETLRANGLKVLADGLLFDSQAVLIRSAKARHPFSDEFVKRLSAAVTPRMRQLIDLPGDASLPVNAVLLSDPVAGLPRRVLVG